jgi:hypothetical protein
VCFEEKFHKIMLLCLLVVLMIEAYGHMGRVVLNNFGGIILIISVLSSPQKCMHAITLLTTV